MEWVAGKAHSLVRSRAGLRGAAVVGKTSARPQRAEHHVREGTAQVSVPCTSLVACICMAWKAARAPLVRLLFLG